MCERLGLFCAGKVNHPGNLSYVGQTSNVFVQITDSHKASLLPCLVSVLPHCEIGNRDVGRPKVQHGYYFR